VDFVRIAYKFKSGLKFYYPEFLVNNRGKDLMMRGGSFYGIWDETAGLWSTNEYDVARLVDAEIRQAIQSDPSPEMCRGMYLEDFGSTIWTQWKRYVKSLPDKWKELDCDVIFANSEVTKDSYASKRLPYAIGDGDMKAYEELISTLYEPAEREKIEWAIGSIIFGDSKWIQKFIVLYGSAGSGKSTILNIIQMLFDGYYSVFEAKALGSSNNQFALETFRSNPLLAIQHDGDLSRIEDNTKLNSIISHERIVVNEKFKGQYELAFHSFLMMGTNTPVKITDAKSGIIRRLIDVVPSGNKIPYKHYTELMNRIQFELGAIAKHCLDIYEALGPGYYDTYIPVNMISATNDFYDFVEYHYDEYKEADSITLSVAWRQYKEYVEFANIPYSLSHRRFKEELKNYFADVKDRVTIDGVEYRNLYSGFRADKFQSRVENKMDVKDGPEWLNFQKQPSVFDILAADYPAQYAASNGNPLKGWAGVTTTLSDLNTGELHWVKVPINHIVIDFDLKNKNGEKDLKKNINAASMFPPTYAELSKSGGGIHLHYIYAGDPTLLSPIYKDGIEIKVYKGNLSLRRKLVGCNNLQIATLNAGGLPLKEVKEKVITDVKGFKSEKDLANRVMKALRKEYHKDTSSSINLINKFFEDAYASGMSYDLRSMFQDIWLFASQSSNQSERCMKLVEKMHLCSKDVEDADTKVAEPVDISGSAGDMNNPCIFDIECVPNLFMICYGYKKDIDKYGRSAIKALINPTATEIENFASLPGLVGFNNLKYDNPMVYAGMMGYGTKQLYETSDRIINDKSFNGFYESKKLSMTDLYDLASTKQGLKKWEIQMEKEGIDVKHHELGLPWDQPIPEELWPTVKEYCIDDVYATAKLWDYLHVDVKSRMILADLSGCTPNDSTNTHTKRLIFGPERNPGLWYTDLESGITYDEDNIPVVEGHRHFHFFKDYWDKMNDGIPIINSFPGYLYKSGKELHEMGMKYIDDDGKLVEFKPDDPKMYNYYRGEVVGFGGYVYAEPGMYQNVALLDIASMHPHSILAMQCFGPYTKQFENLVDARVFIKHKAFDKCKDIFSGKLTKYLTDDKEAKSLSTSLKRPINSVYGLTSASFKNEFKDERNSNNIVALRGALFMVNLKHEVQERGFTVAHIKTDSIKIPNATPEIIDFVMEYGKKYGYTFEHEATYERMCLVNDAVYIARDAGDGHWTATGTEFQVPYVFKKLFSHEEIGFYDMTETKSVTSALYLDMNEDLPEGQHEYKFIGRVGLFCPIKPGYGGGLLMRKAGEDKYAAATGTKGYRWLEADDVKSLGLEDSIDISYYDHLCEEAIEHINQFGDFERFASGQPMWTPAHIPDDDELPF